MDRITLRAGRARGRAWRPGRRRGHPLLARARRGDATSGCARTPAGACAPATPYRPAALSAGALFQPDPRGPLLVPRPRGRRSRSIGRRSRHAIHGHGWQARLAARPTCGRRRRGSTTGIPGRRLAVGPITPRQRFTLAPSTADRRAEPLATRAGPDAGRGSAGTPTSRAPRAATITADVRAISAHGRGEAADRAGVAPAPAAPGFGDGMDNCFVGWSRRAVIDWPELGARLVHARPSRRSTTSWSSRPRAGPSSASNRSATDRRVQSGRARSRRHRHADA